MKMKTLTIKQPWAYLICSGIKDIENRTWKCPQKYIGQRVLIHAGLAKQESLQHLLSIQQLQIVNNRISYVEDSRLFTKGAIIGSAKIVDCVINHPSVWAEESELGQDDFTNEFLMPIYNWVLADPILFEKPILNVKGRLGFWDFDLSDEYTKQQTTSNK